MRMWYYLDYWYCDWNDSSNYSDNMNLENDQGIISRSIEGFF